MTFADWQKINNDEEDQLRKTDSNFDFAQAAKCPRGFKKKEYYVVHIIELFLDQRR